jgi:hypothetical protein
MLSDLITVFSYMLMFRVMDTDQVACVGIRKIGGNWQIVDSHYLPVDEYEAWIEFLRSLGYESEFDDLDLCEWLQSYVIAVYPGGTQEEAAMAGWWFWNEVVAL